MEENQNVNENQIPPKKKMGKKKKDIKQINMYLYGGRIHEGSSLSWKF